MPGRWATYIRLGVLDLVRLWSSTQHHVVIVAGICLPILLLLGLKRGHVAELRQALERSPTGRQVVFGSSQHGDLLTADLIAKLERELPRVETIIPDVFRVVNMKSGRESMDITLYATRRPDPLLSHLGAELPRPGERSVILTEVVAKKLGVEVGANVQVNVSRVDSGREETAAVELRVASIIDTGEPGSRAGYVEIGLLDRFSTWTQGFRVADLGWPAGGAPARPGYSSYLAFCPKTRPFTARDLGDLELNYKVVDITEKMPPVLMRLLRPEMRDELRLYQLYSNNPRQPLEAPFRTDVYDPGATDADEAVLPWNDPVATRLHDKPATLVGLTVRTKWLRRYFRDEAILTDVGEDPFRTRVVEAPKTPTADRLDAPLSKGDPLSLKLLSGKSATASDTLAVVPAEVVAWLVAERTGAVEYDPARRIFKRPAPTHLYTRARSYATTVDDVIPLVDALWERDFSVQAEHARIKEIHRQTESLELLVLVVGVGVLLFGVLTVVSVLHDSTDRKRGTIGILRVMGTSRAGIFLLIFIRAAVIGLLAFALCAVVGWAIAAFLTWSAPASLTWLAWKPTVAVELRGPDYFTVLGGSLLCCMIGALWPAWRASRLDPFDAIVEGRFR